MKNPTFTGKELAEATRGSWRDGRLPAEAVAVYTDTRVAGEGRLFLALPGERFDAHDYLAQAVAAGAGGLCIRRDRAEKLPEPCPVPVLEVDDTLAAYQKIANFHRRRFPELKLVAVTGSVGKTSVKEIVRAILTAASTPEEVLYTEGNTNNQIGVPQNLLRLNSRHRYAVIEMGTNHHGEIEPLSRMTEPLASLVNSIAPCHLEFLGSLEGVAREKSHIFCGLPESGAAVIPADGPAVEVLEAAAESYRVFRFGEDVSRCDVAARYLGGTLEGSRFELSFRTGERFTLEWALTGRHQARNAAAAAALAVAIGIPPETIAAGAVHARLPGMRSKVTRLDGVTYVNDAYNANPGSMRAALANLAEFADPARLVLVLGEMRELGGSEAAEHRALVENALQTFPGVRLLTVGRAFGECPGALRFDRSEEVGETLAKLVRDGDLVFAKGSRGIAVELALPEAAR